MLTVVVGGQAARPPSAGAYKVDDLTTFLDLLFVAIIALTLLFAPDYLEARDLPLPEFAAVLIFALTGAMLISGLGRPAASCSSASS